MTNTVINYLGETKLELGAATMSGDRWRLRRDDNQIAWLVLDEPESSTNTVSFDTLSSLGEKLGEIESELPRALVVRSAKSSGFIAGADISQFESAGEEGDKDVEAIEGQLLAGHDILDRLESLECPTIAVVHGYTLGAGFEIAYVDKGELVPDHEDATSVLDQLRTKPRHDEKKVNQPKERAARCTDTSQH